ncbi:MAG: bile acid:sodium symporter family protein [Paenirhodobacter sp.]|uniref:bile acid:sodium symporter family protein n=1 Tax=Paenirhodobacter sp. TaxID=1965326 RepID=UPI003D0E0501
MIAFLSVFLPVAMMVLMLTLGLRLPPHEIAAEIRAPRALALGLAAQLIGLPALALAIGRMLDLPVPIAAGLMLVAASPGGVSSNYAARLAGGRIGLSVTMTAVTSLIAPVTLPVVLGLAGVSLPEGTGLWRISVAMTGVALVPMLAGMALARLAPRVAGWLAPRLDPLAKGLFLAIVVATFVQNRAAIGEIASAAGLAVAALALAGPVLGVTVARAGRLGRAQVRTIAIECALQNVAIAIFVANALLQRPDLSAVGLLYALAMNVVALVLIGAGGLRRPRAAQTE